MVLAANQGRPDRVEGKLSPEHALTRGVRRGNARAAGPVAPATTGPGDMRRAGKICPQAAPTAHLARWRRTKPEKNRAIPQFRPRHASCSAFNKVSVRSGDTP